MRKVQYTVEELTCPECGFVAVNANGLRGHRQFKHSVRPSGAQLPLQKQDLLVSESKLTELLDERFAVVSEQVNELAGALEQLAEAAKGDGAAIDELRERLSAAERKTIDDFSPIEKAQFFVPWMQSLDPDEVKQLAHMCGHDVQLVPAVDPEVSAAIAETFRKQEEEVKTIQGKTDRPGFRYLENLDLSVYVGEEELAKEMLELIEATARKKFEEIGDQIANKIKIATELVEKLAEIQRRRREGH